MIMQWPESTAPLPKSDGGEERDAHAGHCGYPPSIGALELANRAIKGKSGQRKMAHTSIQIGTAHFNMTAYGQAKISDGFFLCVEAANDKIVLPLRLFLYSASIELGLKASVLCKDNTPAKQARLKALGHDLIGVYGEFQKYFENDSLWNASDLEAVTRINKYFKGNGLEYITIDMKMALMKGGKDFPAISDLQTAAEKMNAFLARHDFHIDCQ